MKFILNIALLLAFFIAFKMYNLYTATAVLIIAALVQALILYIIYRKLEFAEWLTVILIIVFGAATLLLHDKELIKWKFSIVNWAFGIGIIISQYVGKKPIMQRLLDHAITMKAKIWRKLNTAWAIFFLLLGFLNIYIMYHFSDNAWVNFKTFGDIGLTLAFIVCQVFYLARHIEHDKEKQ
ncbi:Intracellular septation protein [Piscirickettsia salmonis]|uniref:septation protein A n=1 Tax=Piscirickettsia salmonis TaxID=1238 RepID=UPI0012B6CBC6|nr:septation protein A [Piscirickettsia salmonis]QGP51486.1 Intracellular septation protein [Piscirickettsia salmonis]QGP53331.1 Intracellular septation protein [Piscirickettsia salmonis]QGP60751.1 Intracellular septation protein [Piscirickettsia salmonis]QGP62896.1 Intracellular septation protein [Piscirickettsia salmonis]